MDTSAHIIGGLLDVAKRKRDAALFMVEKAKREAERAEIEIEAFEAALAAVSASDPAPYSATPPSASAPTIRHGGIVKRTNFPPPGLPVSFTGKWVAVFRDMFNNAVEPYSYDDVVSAAARQGNNSSIGSLRAQMMKAVDSGLFTRVEAGKFSITEQGMALIGADVPNENGPPEGGPDAEEVSASSEQPARNEDGPPRSLFP